MTPRSLCSLRLKERYDADFGDADDFYDADDTDDADNDDADNDNYNDKDDAEDCSNQADNADHANNYDGVDDDSTKSSWAGREQVIRHWKRKNCATRNGRILRWRFSVDI